MDKTRFLTIFPTFESLDVVRETLPTVIAETITADARLIVHDSSVSQRDEKWAWLQEICRPPHVFLMLTAPLSMGHARNACLSIGSELYLPDYVCALEDDHGYRPGFIGHAIDVMDEHYGRPTANGLRAGLFTGCNDWPVGGYGLVPLAEGSPHLVPSVDEDPGPKGGGHNGCRIAPLHHWREVLKGYDLDEYPMSRFQTSIMGYRNYYRGFTRVVIDGNTPDGTGVYMLQRDGHGVTDPGEKRWDDDFCASDPRARYRPTPGLSGASPTHDAAADGTRATADDWTREKVVGLFPVRR